MASQIGDKVPLAIYQDGERIVVGESTITKIGPTGVEVENKMFDQYKDLLENNDSRGFYSISQSISLKTDSLAEVSVVKQLF